MVPGTEPSDSPGETRRGDPASGKLSKEPARRAGRGQTPRGHRAEQPNDNRPACQPDIHPRPVRGYRANRGTRDGRGSSRGPHPCGAEPASDTTTRTTPAAQTTRTTLTTPAAQTAVHTATVTVMVIGGVEAPILSGAWSDGGGTGPGREPRFGLDGFRHRSLRRTGRRPRSTPSCLRFRTPFWTRRRRTYIIAAMLARSILTLQPGMPSGAALGAASGAASGSAIGELWQKETVALTATYSDRKQTEVSCAVATRGMSRGHVAGAWHLDTSVLISARGFILQGDVEAIL